MKVKDLIELASSGCRIALIEKVSEKMFADELFIANRNSKVWDFYSNREVSYFGPAEREDCELFITIKEAR